MLRDLLNGDNARSNIVHVRRIFNSHQKHCTSNIFTYTEFYYSVDYIDMVSEGIVIGKGHKIYNKSYNGDNISYHGYFVYDIHTLLGTYVCYSQNGRYECKYNGSFKNYLPNGYGVYEFVGGDVFKGHLKNDTYNGYGEYLWHSGECYKGNFESDNFSGFGQYIYTDKTLYEGYFVDDMCEGYGKLTYTNGFIIEGLFINGEYIHYNCPMCRTPISRISNIDQNADDKDECPICRNSENIKFMITNCNHKFCSSCIDEIVDLAVHHSPLH